MSGSPNSSGSSPERPISELCMNLENQFVNMHDLSKAEGMRIYARVRPMLNSEVEAGYKECIGTVDHKTIRAVVPASSAKYKSSSHLNQDIIKDFTFTAAYGPEVGQFVFFEECMMSTMQNFIEGQNSLLFSYGTTGSGKTFTLQGDTDNPGIIPLSLHLFFSSIENQLLDRIVIKPDKFADVIVLNDNEVKREIEIKEQLLSGCDSEEWNNRNSTSTKSFAMVLCDTFSENFEAEGRETTLCPQEMEQAQAAALMRELSKRSADQQKGCCSVWISFVEVYNENIYDLLQPNVNQRSKLTLGEDKNGDVYVKGLREVCVSNSYEALKLLNFGQRNLNIAATKLNYRSSRSHCIFTVKVVRIPDLENMTYAKVNRLSFCDLAGSERAAKSQTTGVRLKEAGCINTSLLVLGRCIEQLRLKPSLRDKKLIPFRESKLTRLFSGFFTGRGKAVMITNASPSELTFDETLHVLRFSALAKELIINDSYIATASSTLQSITNMWTNTRVNSTVSSDKSISFEDSVDDVIQEKDELIEKLLDLAESLRNNLEREKKEKAELEVKIRDDVCKEYSEYSDELLENQRQNFVEEREAIRDIYQKRISAMEEMYENIIKDYKLQLEESDSSEDEAFEVVKSEKMKECNEAGEQLIKDECMENTDFENSDLSKVTEESKKTKEELNKTVDYSLSLEMELEAVRKELEDIKLQLQVSMQDNEIMKKELDSYKIDCYAYRTQIDDLLKEKLDLEQDITSITKDLASLTDEKDTLHQNLIDSQVKVASCSNEIENLLNRISELLQKQEKFENSEKSLEEAHLKNEEIGKKLLSVSHELEEEREKRANLEFHIVTLETKISELQKERLDIAEKNNFSESLSNELYKAKQENTELINKLKNLEDSEFNLNETLSELKAEMERLNEVHSDAAKQHETEAKKAEAELDSLNKTLHNALTFNTEREKELEALQTECNSLKEEVCDWKDKADDLSAKLESASKHFESTKFYHKQEIDDLLRENNSRKTEVTELQELIKQLEDNKSQLEAENLKYKQEFEVMKKKLEGAEFTISQQNDNIENMLKEINQYKTEIETLTNLNSQMEEKLNIENESENLKYNQDLDVMKKGLVEAECTISKQKDDIENMLKEINQYKNEIEILRNMNNQIEQKINSQNESENLKYKQEFEVMKKKLEEAEFTISKQNDNIKNMLKEINNQYKTEIEALTNLNSQMEEQLNIEKESEKLKFNQELNIMKKGLEEAECTISKQKDDIENMLKEINQYKNEIEILTNVNNQIEQKINAQNEFENDMTNSNNSEVAKRIEELTEKLNEKESECLGHKNEISVVKEASLLLEEKLSSLSAEFESEKLACKQELDHVTKNLDEAQVTINKQREKVESLLADNNLNKLEIEKLTTLNKDLNEKISLLESETESEKLVCKQELDHVTKNLDEAQVTINKQREEVKSFLADNNFNKNEIEKLTKLNKDLNEKISLLESQTDSEKYMCKQELQDLKEKLNEAELTISKQKEDLENLLSDSNLSKNELETVRNLNKELSDKISFLEFQNGTEKLMYSQELENLKEKLNEAELTISKQKEDLKNLLSDSNLSKSELEKIKNLNKELSDKISFLESQNDVIFKMVEILENCELHATEKIKKMDSHSAELKDEFEKLAKQNKANSEDQEKVILYKLVDVLQKCEVLASSKAKELHTSSIKHVEQIMDFEKCVKLKEKDIEGLKNDYNTLQKQLKESESVLKKQLQAEKQQYRSEIDSIRNKQLITENENKSLKESLNQIIAEKEKLKSKISEIEAATKKKEKSKEKKQEKESENQVQDKNVPNTEVPLRQSDRSNKRSERKSKEKKQDKESENQVQYENIPAANTEVPLMQSDRSNKRSERKSKEEKKEEFGKQHEEKKTKKTKTQSEGKKASEKSKTVSKDKKLNPKIFEETDENSSSGQTQKEQRVGRRELRCMNNIESNINVVQNKDLNSAKTKVPKRKGPNDSEENLSEHVILKRIKLQKGNENISKPQNLAIRMLKTNIGMNDIALPSPRMTRGRKRLVQSKIVQQCKASPRTLRS